MTQMYSPVPINPERLIRQIRESLERAGLTVLEVSWHDTRPDAAGDVIFLGSGWVTLTWGGERASPGIVRELVQNQYTYYQQQFFQHMLIHELRNPLAVLSGQMELLQREVRLPSLRQEAIGAAIERMVALLDQSLPAGPSLSRHRVAFYRLWLEEQALLSYITDPQNIRLIYAGEELEIFTDLPKLQQIYHNLLRNAIEAALPGDHIVTRVVSQPEGVMLLVQNPRLVGAEVDVAAFQPFVSSKGEGHQGMGLAVCRHLAALLGAEIGYRPDSGFWVRLPVSRSD